MVYAVPILERKLGNAIVAAPKAFCRTNKMRDDGLIYEVGYVNGTLITDDTIVIEEAFANHAIASEAREQLQGILYARAALNFLHSRKRKD